jgi:hypothetical protein
MALTIDSSSPVDAAVAAAVSAVQVAQDQAASDATNVDAVLSAIGIGGNISAAA